MNITRLLCLSSALFVVACASDDGTVAVDAEWNLTCPVIEGMGCNAPSDTCLGSGGQRAIVGARGESACNGAIIDVSCSAERLSDGRTFVDLLASAGDDYAFELNAIIDQNGVADTCDVTITEQGAGYGVGYGFGGCVGESEPTSVDRPCQISSVLTVGGDVEFDIECRPNPLTSSGNGFNVGAVGAGPATIRFSNCTGF